MLFVITPIQNNSEYNKKKLLNFHLEQIPE